MPFGIVLDLIPKPLHICEAAMARFCLVLSLLFVFNSLHSIEDSPLSLVNLTEQPLARVHGTVNVISGDWVDQDVHERPSGPDSYAIGHSYTSNNSDKGSLSDGWDFLWPSVLETTGGDGSYAIILHEAGGSKLAFKDLFDQHPTPLFLSSGYTHISTIDHPVTRDISRIQIRRVRHKDASWIVTLSDGTERFFESCFTKDRHNRFYSDVSPSFYHMTKEVLPSKNVRHFEYDKDGNLISIRTVSSCGKYLIQKITLKITKDAIHAKSLDGREVTFELKDVPIQGLKHESYNLVRKIHRLGTPERSYSYSNGYGYQSRIEQRSWATGLMEEAKFYSGDDTHIDGKKVHVPKDDRDFTRRRVSEIRTKRFRGEKPFMKHGFYYDKKDSDGDYRILRAVDADGSKTGYMWNPQHRIIWSTYEDKHEKRLASEHFVWGTYPDTGRLLNRAVFDEKKNPLLVREWDFTKEGFPEEERWHGIFTKYDAPTLSLKDKRYPKGGETRTVKATWDKHGNQLTHLDAEGNLTECEYDRCFVKARYTFYKCKKILSREFFTYDSAGCLIETIQDNGSKKDKDWMEGVTRRHITLVKPRKKAPYFGESEQIIHKVWTPDSGELVALTEYFERDSKGRVICHRKVAQDSLERSTSYTYDSIDRVVETTFQDGSFERIVYDDVSGLIKEKIYPYKRFQYTYDLFSRVISEKELFADGTFFETSTEYDKSGRVVTIRDSHGQRSVVEKDLLGRTVSKTLPEVMTSSGLVSPVEKYRYEGRSVFVTSPTGAVTETVYSSLGKPLLVKHPEGYSTTYTYDLLGRLLETSDGNLVQKTTYDTHGRIARTETWAGNECVDWVENEYSGEDLIKVKGELLKTKMSYDAFGRCIEKRLVDRATDKEIVEKIGYDGFGNVVRHESNDVVTLTTFDALGRVVETKTESLDGQLQMHATNQYDLAGHVIESAVQRDESTWLRTRTVYGAYGLPSSVEGPDGLTVQFFYKQKGSSWIKTTVDPTGVTTKETFIGKDFQASRKVTDPLGAILSSEKTYVNILGLPETIVHDVYYQGVKEETIKTLLEYDQFGRRTGLREAAGTDEEVCSLRSYDRYSRCVEETLPSGIRFSLRYDRKGRLVQKTSSDGSIDFTFAYTYHDCVKEARDVAQHTTTSRTYDAFKHILTETQSNGLALSYSYNQYGMPSSVVLPDDSKVAYTFRGGLLEKASRTTNHTSYSFAITKRNSAGMVLETSLPLDGGTVQYSYDLMGHVLAKQQQKASETRVYDQIGRVSSRTIDGVTEQYRYDYLSQLISDNGRERRYDSILRLREKEGEVAQVTRRQQITKLGKKEFSYDADGRRIRDGEAVLRYDALGRLTSYEKNGLSEKYEYDAFSRRMTKTSAAGVERYLWLGQQEVGTYDDRGHALSFRLLAEGVGSEGGATIAVELNGTPYTAFSDLSGNIRSLVSSSGQEVHSAVYSAFARTSTTGLDCPWGFFSKRQDELSGYVMFLYRLYDPETGSWITQDPLGLEGGPNLYGYVRNNPLSLFDMLGLFDCGDFFDSCCSAISSAWDSVCDACSSAYDSVCSGCSSACSAVSSACSAAYDYCSSCVSSVGCAVANCASSVVSACSWAFTPSAPQSSTPAPSCYILQNKMTVTPETKVQAGVYVFPIGTGDNFIMEGRRDPSIWKRTTKLQPGCGMNTSFYECLRRAEEIIDLEKGIDNVVIIYNPKENFIIQLLKAGLNAFGFMTEETKTIMQQEMSIMKAGVEAGFTGFSPQIHSQCGGIFDCILRTKEFSRNDPNSYFYRLGTIHTYGSETFIVGAVNHVSFFDIVPLLNPRNWYTMICHPECVEFTPFKLQSPLKAHGFDNPSYQEVFQSVIRSQ